MFAVCSSRFLNIVIDSNCCKLWHHCWCWKGQE